LLRITGRSAMSWRHIANHGANRQANLGRANMAAFSIGIIRLPVFFVVAFFGLACEPDQNPSVTDFDPRDSVEASSPSRPLTPKLSHRPNVVLIVGDDIGVDLVGAYAGYFPATPAPNAPDTPVLDALAREGLLFRNAWTNPGCSPSRAQILTGRHSRRTGIGGVVKWQTLAHQAPSPGLSHDIPLLPQILKEAPAPYASAAVGKWHLGSPEQGGLHALGPNNAWFDHWAGSPFNLNGEGIGYRRWPKTFATEIAPGEDECGPPYPCEAMLDESHACEEYATVDTIDDAIQLLGTLAEPFFLYVPFNAPHTPLDLPGCALAATCSEDALSYANAPLTAPERTRAMTRTMDHQIGRLLCAIDRDDTVVIFIGDNGTTGNDSEGRPRGITPPFPGDHGKTTVYNGGVNVPLIIRGPGIVSGTSEALVNSTDLFATVADLAGVTGGVSIPAHSVSLAPYLYGQAHPAPRQTIHAERFTPTYVPTDLATGSPPADYRSNLHRRAIRNDRFKLIARHIGGRPVGEEFYDLLHGNSDEPRGQRQRDDFEQNDLMNQRKQWERGGEIESNYWVLKQELDRVLPALP